MKRRWAVCPPFSTRLEWDPLRSPLHAAHEARLAAGAEVLDLTSSNPTAVGLSQKGAAIRRALADPGLLRYDPCPRGLAVARAAVACYYRARGVDSDPGEIFLCASTSEAYAWVFKLLASPGQEVLVPRPSYPLFEYLARLEGLTLRPYRLELTPRGHWHIDLEHLAGALTPRSRAVVVVSPNNPTGSYLKGAELAAINQLCRRQGLALVVDEVFADYGLAEDRERIDSAAANRAALTFTLSGLSKVAGLPQLKLGWMLVSGPRRLREKALAGLELIADTYLSVATPVQLAAAALLAGSEAFRQQALRRLRGNRRVLERVMAGCRGVRVLPAEGGWSAILMTAGRESDEALAARLLDEAGLWVHPGFFYDFEQEGVLVISLLTPRAVFREGTQRLAACLWRG